MFMQIADVWTPIVEIRESDFSNIKFSDPTMNVARMAVPKADDTSRPVRGTSQTPVTNKLI